MEIMEITTIHMQMVKYQAKDNINLLNDFVGHLHNLPTSFMKF